MTKNEISISRRSCFLYQDEAATHLLIQPIDEHDLEGLDQEVETIKELWRRLVMPSESSMSC